jgi:peptidoglycan/xylan/chitin deacetylase (PgdA/CDA1 family)
MMFPRPPYPANIPRMIWKEIVVKVPGEFVYLTFDDGPYPPAILSVLDILATYGTKATFFFSGMDIERHPMIVRQVHAAGHRIGSHGYSHRQMLFRRRTDLIQEIDRTSKLIEDITGTPTFIFRPPFGVFGSALVSILRERRMSLVLWDVDTQDYVRGGSVKFVQTVLQKTSHGSLLLLHANALTSIHLVQYLPCLIRELSAKGMQTSVLPASFPS